MTVQELIDELQKVPNAQAIIRIGNGWDNLEYDGLVITEHDEVLKVDTFTDVIYLDTLNNSGDGSVC